MLILQGLRTIKRLSLPKSASIFRKMTSTAFDLSESLTSQTQEPTTSVSASNILPSSTQAFTDAVSTPAAVNGISMASGRPVEPRRIKLPIAVAPMVDVTTSHFLQLCRIISPNFTMYTEMIHCNALVYNPKDLYNFFGEPWEGKVVQLGGSDPEAMAKAAKLVQDNGYKELNLNVGCPSPRVQKGAFGAVLMKTPSIVVDIIQEMRKVGVTIPITVKCRIGVDNLDSYEYLHDFIKLISTTTSVDHFIVHARKCWLKGLSPKQNRSVPPLKHEVVYQLAKDFPHLTITINGGFNTTDQLKEQLNLVDGVMVGREIMDRPMFLAKVDAACHNVPPEEIKSTEEVIEEFLEYVLAEHERGTPHSNSIVMAPLKMLYGGRRGREYRRRLAALILPRTKPLPDIVRDMRQMLQEMDFSMSSSENESDHDEPESMSQS
ncbi:hypothetical protein BGZ79_000342 [Entomortierella chlamydospora]|nr:hypothetical protein BGZ79_000342 [Entomortierella chlamydospora]